MALKKAYGVRVGLDFPEAYHSLGGMDIDVFNSRLYVHVDTYVDQQVKADGAGPIERKTFCIENWQEPDGTKHDDFNDFFLQAPLAAASVKDVILKALYQWVKANVTFYGDAVDV